MADQVIYVNAMVESSKVRDPEMKSLKPGPVPMVATWRLVAQVVPAPMTSARGSHGTGGSP